MRILLQSVGTVACVRLDDDDRSVITFSSMMKRDDLTIARGGCSTVHPSKKSSFYFVAVPIICGW